MRFCTIVTVLFLASFAANAQKVEFGARNSDPSRISIFPNPATDHLTLRVEGVDIREVGIVIHSIIGNEIAFESEIVNDDEIRIRVKELASAPYLVSVQHEPSGVRVTKKFLKK